MTKDMNARIRWAAIALAVVVVVIALVILRWRTTREAGAAQPRIAKEEDARHSIYKSEPSPLRMPPTLQSSSPSLPPVHTGPAPIEIETDPQSANYDANKLFAVTGGSPVEFFKREPRDDGWATDRERIINDLTLPALREIDPNVKVITECHTGVCKVSIHSSKFFNVGVFGPYPFTCLAEHVAPDVGPDVSPDGIDPEATDPYSDVYMFFGQKSHDTDAEETRKRCTEAREWFVEHLEKYRTMTEIPW